MPSIMPTGKQQYTNNAGVPLAGGKVFTFEAGTTTPKATYLDAAGTTENQNPVPLDARGEALIFWHGAYDVKVTDVNGLTIYTVKGFQVPLMPGELSDVGGTDLIKGTWFGGVTANVSALGAEDGPSLLGFIQGGVGAVARPALDKLREAAVTLDDFKLAVETDWANAANRACTYCYQTGATLRLKGQAYPGARIEVHGTFNVEGNGATVDFLGVGYTIIAGLGAGTDAIPSAWGTDGSIENAAAYIPAMYRIASAVAVGDDSIGFADVAGLNAGDVLFLAGNPTSASSSGNYIPASFEFAQVQSIAGNVVTLNGKTRNTYTTSGAAFKTPGLARGCRISNLRLKSTGSEAYQLTIRSALNVVIDNVEFAGRDTLGSATFVEGLALRNFRSSGTGGNWSFARGTVAALLDSLVFQYRSGMTADTNGIFIEESCYDISIRSVRGYGASFSVRQMDMTGAVIRRAITVIDSTFDTAHAPGGAASPMQCGTAAGVDLEFVNCTFAGAVVVPNAGTYPGVNGAALCWITGNQTFDKLKFSACHFKSATLGASFKAGGGALGMVLFDDLCTYEGCDSPASQYTPRGAWVPFALSGAFTPINGYGAPAYRIKNNQVFLAGAVQVNAAASGDTLATLPAPLRPLANKLLPAGSAQTGAGAAGSVAFGLDTAGALVARWSPGVAYFGLEGLSYALDA